MKKIFCRKNKAAAQSLRNRKSKNRHAFFEHKLAAETDEKGHTDRYQDKENKRQTKIIKKKHSDCKIFHRINPDEENFDAFFEISKIQNYIAQSNKEKGRELENKIKDQEDKIIKQENKIKEQKSKFAKELLKELLSYVSSISMLLKHIRYIVKKYSPRCKYEKT